jgi:hypothetical protein
MRAMIFDARRRRHGELAGEKRTSVDAGRATGAGRT